MKRRERRRKVLLWIAMAVAVFVAVAAVMVHSQLSRARKVRRSLGDLFRVRAAVESYLEVHGHAPPGPATIVAIESVYPLLVPAHARELKVRDSWGYPFVLITAGDGIQYIAASPGSDGVFEAEVGGPILTGETWRDLVVLSSGGFQYPEGYLCGTCDTRAWVERDRALAAVQWKGSELAELTAAYRNLALKGWASVNSGK